MIFIVKNSREFYVSIFIGDQSYIKNVSDDSINDSELFIIIGLLRRTALQPRAGNT